MIQKFQVLSFSIENSANGDMETFSNPDFINHDSFNPVSQKVAIINFQTDLSTNKPILSGIYIAEFQGTEDEVYLDNDSVCANYNILDELPIEFCDVEYEYSSEYGSKIPKYVEVNDGYNN